MTSQQVESIQGESVREAAVEPRDKLLPRCDIRCDFVWELWLGVERIAVSSWFLRTLGEGGVAELVVDVAPTHTRTLDGQP